MPKGETYEIPFGQLTPGSAAVELIHTVDGHGGKLRHAKLTDITVCNLTAVQRTFGVFVDNDGGTDWGTARAIFNLTPIPGRQTVSWDHSITLLAGATIGVRASAGGVCNFTLSGVEVVAAQ